jgi:hypothetical protein
MPDEATTERDAQQSLAAVRWQPGQRVRVTQTIAFRQQDWHASVEGKLRSIVHAPTGSWHAHGKHARLWLWRLELEKADGEISWLVVDRYTRVEVLDRGH